MLEKDNLIFVYSFIPYTTYSKGHIKLKKTYVTPRRTYGRRAFYYTERVRIIFLIDLSLSARPSTCPSDICPWILCSSCRSRRYFDETWCKICAQSLHQVSAQGRTLLEMIRIGPLLRTHQQNCNSQNFLETMVVFNILN